MYDDPQALFNLDSIGCQITLAQIYDKVEFEK
jgi:hypothetical protein